MIILKPNTNIFMKSKINTEESKDVAISLDKSTETAAENLTRPLKLHGSTYKLKSPILKEAFYITINDINDNGKIRPYEIFINSKNLQHFSWLVALTRMISAIMRRDTSHDFLIPELKSIFDPNGGYYKNGKYIPSLVSEIGDIIEQHLESLKNKNI